MADWYTGPEEGDENWSRLPAKLESGNLADVVAEVDKASTKVVAHLADLHIQSLKKRGLLVGYVQSGKDRELHGGDGEGSRRSLSALHRLIRPPQQLAKADPSPTHQRPRRS